MTLEQAINYIAELEIYNRRYRAQFENEYNKNIELEEHIKKTEMRISPGERIVFEHHAQEKDKEIKKLKDRIVQLEWANQFLNGELSNNTKSLMRLLAQFKEQK